MFNFLHFRIRTLINTIHYTQYFYPEEYLLIGQCKSLRYIYSSAFLRIVHWPSQELIGSSSWIFKWELWSLYLFVCVCLYCLPHCVMHCSILPSIWYAFQYSSDLCHTLLEITCLHTWRKIWGGNFYNSVFWASAAGRPVGGCTLKCTSGEIYATEQLGLERDDLLNIP